MTFNKYVQPIKVPPQDFKPKNRGTVIGYGRNVPQPHLSFNEMLLTVDVTVAGLKCKYEERDSKPVKYYISDRNTLQVLLFKENQDEL